MTEKVVKMSSGNCMRFTVVFISKEKKERFFVWDWKTIQSKKIHLPTSMTRQHLGRKIEMKIHFWLSSFVVCVTNENTKT